MSFTNDDVHVTHQLTVTDTPGLAPPIVLGVAEAKVNGTAWIEGPAVVGDPIEYAAPIPTEMGTLMAAPTTNLRMKPTPFYSLFVKYFARIKSFLKVDLLLNVPLISAKIIHTEVLMAKTKNFLIDHPTKDGKKLVYACLEGPENSVYIRGRVRNKTEIELPEYWKNLIDETSITVSLTPVGAHQDIIIKRWDNLKVYLQAKGGMPIDCFYHIFAERKDVEKLITEIEK